MTVSKTDFTAFRKKSHLEFSQDITTSNTSLLLFTTAHWLIGHVLVTRDIATCTPSTGPMTHAGGPQVCRPAVAYYMH